MRDDNVSTEKLVGERIGLLRSARNETQEQLGEAVGVTREVVQHWERASRNVKAAHIAKLARHFDTSADYILGLREYKTLDVSVGVACDVTGLSQKAVETLQEMDKERLDILSQIIESYGLDELLVTAIALKGFVEEAEEFMSKQSRDTVVAEIVHGTNGAQELSESDGYNVANVCYDAMEHLKDIKFGRYQLIEAGQDIADGFTGVQDTIKVLNTWIYALSDYLPENEEG